MHRNLYVSALIIPMLIGLTVNTCHGSPQESPAFMFWKHAAEGFYLDSSYDSSIMCYDKAIGINPTSSTAWSGKGLALYGSGEFDESIECFDKSAELDPTSLFATSATGFALAASNNYASPSTHTCPYTGYSEIDEAIKAIMDVGPYDAYQAYKASQDAVEGANKYADENGLDSTWNNEADAIRHFMWNFEMTKSIGEEQAKKIADSHEALNQNSPEEKTMDEHNNEAGRKLANDPDYKDLSPYEAAEKALREGKLIPAP